MNEAFADRLTAACRRRGNALCVGLDPRWEQLPLALRRRHSQNAMTGAVEEFCLRVLDIVAPLVPVVKPQSAFFEACGPAGMTALAVVLRQARNLGLLTILDSKRNDIASTATAYAEAVFGPQAVWPADAMTINPYLGRDAVEPFLACARRAQAGVFVLVRTSNAGAGQFQDLDCGGKPLYEHVAAAVGEWAGENLGTSGLGDVGAVIGATHPAELASVRALLPHAIFLIPGYGAQGGSACDTAAGFRADGTGAVVNSSRGITACFAPDELQWEAAIEAATRAAIAALQSQTPMNNLTQAAR
jgi:orotidine-5'-phosphate decarboxylase